jgi:hypothetical protein
MVEACKTSGWQAERHVFFGTPEMIAEKVQTTAFGSGRRLFYAAIDHAGTGKVYEYEHRRDDTYSVKVAETNSTDAFNQAVEKAMFANKGQSCVGVAVQSLSEFKALNFRPLADVSVTSGHDYSEFLPLAQASQHAIAGGNPSERFTRVSFHILC